MNYNDMRKPLLQSGLVLLAVLIIIGFVAGSGAEGFFGGIASIIKGILYSVLFGVALGLSLVISVALLIAVFIGAIAIYSPDKAKDMFTGLQQKIGSLVAMWTESRSKTSSADISTATEASGHPPAAQQSFATSAALQNVRDEFSTELVTMKKSIDSLKEKSSSFDQVLAEMEKSLSVLPDATISERIDQIDVQQKEIETKLDKCLEQLDSLSAATKTGTEQFQDHEKNLSSALSDIQSLTSGVEELRNDMVKLKNSSPPEQSTTVAKEEHRIFSYLEKETDKKQFAELVSEAVQQNMTYAEIDAFLSKSLPKKVDEIIKDHPTLTKEYIRECKNS